MLGQIGEANVISFRTILLLGWFAGLITCMSCDAQRVRPEHGLCDWDHDGKAEVEVDRYFRGEHLSLVVARHDGMLSRHLVHEDTPYYSEIDCNGDGRRDFVQICRASTGRGQWFIVGQEGYLMPSTNEVPGAVSLRLAQDYKHLFGGQVTLSDQLSIGSVQWHSEQSQAGGSGGSNATYIRASLENQADVLSVIVRDRSIYSRLPAGAVIYVEEDLDGDGTAEEVWIEDSSRFGVLVDGLNRGQDGRMRLVGTEQLASKRAEREEALNQGSERLQELLSQTGLSIDDLPSPTDDRTEPRRP